MWKRFAESTQVIALGLLAALLPSPVRDRIESDHLIDVPLFSFAIGAIQAPVGIVLFMAGGLSYMAAASGAQGMILLENWFPELKMSHFQGVALLNWMAWFFHPAAWLFGMLALTGGARLIAFAGTRTAVAEPVAVAVAIVWRRVSRATGHAERRARFGPERPDRIESSRRPVSSHLTVLSARPKPDWNELATIEIGEKFYRLASVETRRDGRWLAHAYRLREEEPNRVIRRLIRYRPLRSSTTAAAPFSSQRASPPQLAPLLPSRGGRRGSC